MLFKIIFSGAIGVCFVAAATPTETISKDFNLNNTRITLEVPRNLQESFVTSPHNIFITYTGNDTAYSVIYKFSVLSDESSKKLLEGSNFIDTAIKPYSDKEKMLYGKYTILNSFQDNNSAYVHLESFLSKGADEYLPEAYFKIEEYISLKNSALASITCRAAGAKVQKHMIDTTFDLYKGMCHKLIKANRDLLEQAAHALKTEQ